ncbi:MAG: MBL fold metallo-hydrolase [Anaerolineales bacterium]|nr:MBL fold metallo-hydrolase [Anaerolineales bacterium]
MHYQYAFLPALPLVLLLSACAPSTPAATATPEPTATGKPSVTLTYGDNAQVELVTPAGRHIYIDVWNVSLLTKEPSADDVLLTTHMHPDHYFKDFVESFPGRKITMAAGEIDLPDIKVTAIVSAHLPNDPLDDPAKATNFLFLIETGDLRIVHFGDCGQLSFTAGEMAILGKVDLAITQFSNSFSMMDAANRTGFQQMDQVKPRLIIPTHYDKATLEIAVGLWPGFYANTRTVTLSPASIPEKTSLLLMGAEYTVGPYASLYKLAEWK